jgi:hypothetical protein
MLRVVGAAGTSARARDRRKREVHAAGACAAAVDGNNVAVVVLAVPAGRLQQQLGPRAVDVGVIGQELPPDRPCARNRARGARSILSFALFPATKFRY